MAIDLDFTARFVAAHEGVVLRVYRDPVGIETACVGETEPAFINQWRGKAIPREVCMAQFAKRLAEFASAVDRCIERPMSPEQHAACTSLAYNIGVGAFCKSTVARLLNQGDIRGAADAFLMWNKAGGKVLPGLTRRRQEERALFLSSGSVAPPPPPPKRKDHGMFLAADKRHDPPPYYLIDGDTKTHLAWDTVLKLREVKVPDLDVIRDDNLFDSHRTLGR